MREIKFRAWDGERLRKVNTIGWVDEIVDFVTTPRYSGPAEDFSLMQYTGLKDKNGVEIYEGDVLTLKYPRDRRYTVTAKVIRGTQISAMVLKFEDGFTTEEIPLYKISAEHNLEVIGNIYENPELLEREPQ